WHGGVGRRRTGRAAGPGRPRDRRRPAPARDRRRRRLDRRRLGRARGRGGWRPRRRERLGRRLDRARHRRGARRPRPASVVAGVVTFENVFSGRPVELADVDTLVVSAGRTAGDTLYLELEAAGVAVERAGDCLGPRSFEEAIREGTLAGLRA